MYENKGYVPKTNVEYIEGNGRSYPYLYPIGDLVQRSFYRGFHVCNDQGIFLRRFLIHNEQKINYIIFHWGLSSRKLP
jgi:hypothetical protein